MNRKGQLSTFGNTIAILGVALISFVLMVVILQEMRDTIDFSTSSENDTILAANATATTLTNTPSTWTAAKAKNTTWLGFDGIDDRVTIHNNFGTDSPELEMDGRNFTVSLWINLSGRGDFGTPINYTLMFTKDSIGSFGYGLIRGDGNGERGINRTCFYSNTNRTCSLVNMTWGVWHNVIGNFNGTFCNLYVNGTYKSSTACSNPGDAGSFSMLLGASGTTRNPNMSMDEFRLYNRSLSQQEITNIYDSGRVINTSITNKGLVLWLPLNENSGTTTYDLSEQGVASNGTVSGSTYNNDEVNITLTEDTDYVRVTDQFNVTNEQYSWSEIIATYDYEVFTEGKSAANETLVGFSTFADFIVIIVLAIVAAIVIGIIFGAFGGLRRIR